MTTQEQSAIRQVLGSPQWSSVQHLANEICDKINYDSVVRDNEWDTIKTALIAEGQVQGIKRLLQELYNQAQQ